MIQGEKMLKKTLHVVLVTEYNYERGSPWQATVLV